MLMELGEEDMNSPGALLGMWLSWLEGCFGNRVNPCRDCNMDLYEYDPK